MDFIFHDAFADAELLGDFPLGIAVELSHPHDAPAALGQGVDQRDEAPVIETAARLALRRGAHIILKGINLGNGFDGHDPGPRSEEHTSELQSLMRLSYAVFCLKKNTKKSQP